ncbi:Very-short-patch-repair endonuclease [Neorhodopirellula lusitana]|uniref:Very-short-patch-repair endonuclease n=1 Tax=Neorhodopirellula lusitana TaxID=445327 RepID=A0ABY1Q5B0_9BACT|nr:endonuclease domain-containing protein [Neorhodopirellula lusitana]SMP59011.1 Very-short-patch-repair endonuclease [Neorhodopirellula lusitana]
MNHQHASNRRQNNTRSEGLLWSILRGQQLCGLKFRREHPIDPWIVDFACVAKSLVVEIDGGYHDGKIDDDLRRQRDLESRGWKVVRFTDQEVEQDAEAVARGIAAAIEMEYSFDPRLKTGSGARSIRARKPKPK